MSGTLVLLRRHALDLVSGLFVGAVTTIVLLVGGLRADDYGLLSLLLIACSIVSAFAAAFTARRWPGRGMHHPLNSQRLVPIIAFEVLGAAAGLVAVRAFSAPLAIGLALHLPVALSVLDESVAVLAMLMALWGLALSPLIVRPLLPSVAVILFYAVIKGYFHPESLGTTKATLQDLIVIQFTAGVAAAVLFRELVGNWKLSR